MSINATLFVQAIVFAILVWFTMKFVWPPIAVALDERAKKIADGLAAADGPKLNFRPPTSGSRRSWLSRATKPQRDWQMPSVAPR